MVVRPVTKEDHAMLQKHGTLWVLVRGVRDELCGVYKSLATGETHLWFDMEVETIGEDDE